MAKARRKTSSVSVKYLRLHAAKVWRRPLFSMAFRTSSIDRHPCKKEACLHNARFVATILLGVHFVLFCLICLIVVLGILHCEAVYQGNIPYHLPRLEGEYGALFMNSVGHFAEILQATL